MLCEFYSWTFDYVLGLTLRQYDKVFEEMGRINRIRNGSKEEEPMSGDLGATAARKLLPKKELIYGTTR